MTDYDLSRFTEAQQQDYPTALAEIRRGKKTSHWIWYIFPQLKGLGTSSMCEIYGIRDLGEAQAFLNDPYLGANLREISSALLSLDCSDPRLVMGPPDDRKLRSSMTLFSLVSPHDTVFQDVLDKFFRGRPDSKTLEMLGL